MRGSSSENAVESELEGGELIRAASTVVAYVVVGQSAVVLFHLDGAEQRLPACRRILLEDRKEVDECGDGCPRSPEVDLAQLLLAVGHECLQRLIGEQVFARVAEGVHVAQLLEQHVELFLRQAGKAHDGSRKVDESFLREAVFAQARLQGRIAVEATSRVEHEFRRASKNESKPLN